MVTASQSPSDATHPQAESPLKAMLFDSGGVLMQPIGGRWNPRADFEPTLLKYDPTITAAQFAEAFEVGDQFMTAAASTPNHDDYYSVIIKHLGLAPTPELLAELNKTVPAYVVLELFDDVLETLTTLRSRGVRMAVVSDAWPSLPTLHDELGIDEFFEAYAISAVLGCRKPDPRMYRHASDALGLAPAECLFVDDSPKLVAAALDLGYQGRWMRRDPGAQASAQSPVHAPVQASDGREVEAIISLTELIEFF
jgi:putative hydrolase of the HAD superfamily